jgi:uncharacterized Ntn-hydrolase superfamily protein
VGSLERRLKLIEAGRKRRGDQPRREALARLSDEELEAAEESLLAEARARGEQPPPNELLEKMKRWEAETIEQQRRNAEESRRRSLQLPESDE